MPNEDGLLALEAGGRVLLAVADAHYGTFASHALLRGLAETLTEVPASPMDLERAVRMTAMEGPPPEGDSATTLVVVVLRRDRARASAFRGGTLPVSPSAARRTAGGSTTPTTRTSPRRCPGRWGRAGLRSSSSTCPAVGW
jgi:hypothetical protein